MGGAHEQVTTRWLVVALAVALGACGGGGDDNEPAPAQETPGDAPAEATATPEPAPEEAAAVVETLGSVDGGRVRFILTELPRFETIRGVALAE
jgi:hypothetical protein